MPRALSRHRKRLGQVFLRDPLVIEQILQSVALAPHETALEIGPGGGALTAALASHAHTLYAIEIDAAYVATLRRRFADLPHLHLIHADARTYNYALLPSPLVIIANLPYSMGMPILKHLLTFRQRLSRLIIMLQSEVAARLLAVPGGTAYGALSVFFQYYTALSRCVDVSRHAFTPVPAVDSTVLRLEPFAASPWPRHDEALLLRLVRGAFVHRRKTLRANLLAMPQLSLRREQLDALFPALDLSPQVRAQELSVTQFVQLAEGVRVLVAVHPTGAG